MDFHGYILRREIRRHEGHDTEPTHILTQPRGRGCRQAAVLEAGPSRGAGVLALALQRSDRVLRGTEWPQGSLAWPPMLPGHGRGLACPPGFLVSKREGTVRTRGRDQFLW